MSDNMDTFRSNRIDGYDTLLMYVQKLLRRHTHRRYPHAGEALPRNKSLYGAIFDALNWDIVNDVLREQTLRCGVPEEQYQPLTKNHILAFADSIPQSSSHADPAGTFERIYDLLLVTENDAQEALATELITPQEIVLHLIITLFHEAAHRNSYNRRFREGFGHIEQTGYMYTYVVGDFQQTRGQVPNEAVMEWSAFTMTGHLIRRMEPLTVQLPDGQTCTITSADFSQLKQRMGMDYLSSGYGIAVAFLQSVANMLAHKQHTSLDEALMMFATGAYTGTRLDDSHILKYMEQYEMDILFKMWNEVEIGKSPLEALGIDYKSHLMFLLKDYVPREFAEPFFPSTFLDTVYPPGRD